MAIVAPVAEKRGLDSRLGFLFGPYFPWFSFSARAHFSFRILQVGAQSALGQGRNTHSV
jgi:hypothetical protein